jgi:hypothetical protein
MYCRHQGQGENMPPEPSEKGNKTPKVLAALAGLIVLVIAVILGVGRYRQREAEGVVDDAVLQEQPAVTQQAAIPIEQAPLIDYNALASDEALQARMDARKADLGLAQGVDMIVKEDETLRIGDTTVPMREILEKIRLQKGDIVEEGVSQITAAQSAEVERARMVEKLESAEQRLAEVERLLQAPETESSTEAKQAALAEREALRTTVSAYRLYKQLTDEIEELQAAMDSDQDAVTGEQRSHLAEITAQRDTVMRFLRTRVLPETGGEAYGIYVVQPFDNVWNIHFKFLQEYFNGKGISLEATADEPDGRGFSSGVGKILKFSEKMVHIYNLRERKLEFDLNTIQPLTKIVVFNMGQVLSMLEQIDYQKVNRIRFDGNTLWIPAES